MSVGNKDKAERYSVIVRWRDLYDKEHELKIKYNVDKADGFYYQTHVVNDDTSFVISKFDGEKWRMVNVLSEDKRLSIKEDELADRLGDLYNKLNDILIVLKDQE